MRTLKEFVSESIVIVEETNIFESLDDIRKRITGTWRNRKNTFIKSDLDAWDWTVTLIKKNVKNLLVKV